MTIRNLEPMFAPKSLALVGAGTRPRSVGQMLLQNVQQAGFAGQVMPVNPKYESLGGLPCYPNINSLPQAPDLAVLCIGPEHVPQAVAELGARGTRAAVVITAGFSEVGTPEGKALEQQLLDAARPYNLRIIGPNCVGVMVPGVKLNASFAHIAPAAGSLAFVSQSGALCTAILDYVAERDIGFSHFVSLGNSADVDFGDMLDYLASDQSTSAILLYIESVKHTRKFMSAARAASRIKPVVVIKSGRNAAGAKAAASHTGALIGSDAVYDVAFRRAGMLRVYDMEELFDAVETLARITDPQRPFSLGPSEQREQLVIVSNGGGPAVLATDYLVNSGGKLGELSAQTVEQLNKVLPPTWSHGNPVDIIGDADGKRYGDALGAVLAAPEAGAVMVMKCPTAVSDNLEAAKAVVEAAKGCQKLLLTCWLGEATARESRRLFAQADIPTFETPEKTIRSFLHVEEYRHNQALLTQLPPAVSEGRRDQPRVREIIAKALGEGRRELSEYEAKEVLGCYDIPVVKTVTAKDPQAAVEAAEKIGYPVAIKILSPDISHKSDVGGVMLNLPGAASVQQAAQAMLENIGRLKPQARLEGFTVQQMAPKREGGYELIIGVSTDAQFGPVIMFGEGGVGVEVIDDKALGLPPLNALLAREMVERTRIYKRLKGFRDRKPVAMEVIIKTLLQISQLVTDIPEITELDINPLVVDSESGIALDARIKLTDQPDAHRLVISPYPEGMQERITLKNGQQEILRPVKPEDAHGLTEMMGTLTKDDLWQRFRGEYPALSPDKAARLTLIDYDRDMVLVATPEGNGRIDACLVATSHPGSRDCEFTLVVRPDMKAQGLGRALTEKLMRYIAAMPQMASVFGYVKPGNDALIEMVKGLDFTVDQQPDGLLKVSKALR